ncbi:MAG: transcription termination/antitermination protein NusG [Parachlamydiaceae bacterium]|nr:transcription termination/antitermination protein NusG [Parachlamydiaceae bacterium]
MHKWYVVQVVPTHEKKIKKSIEEQRELKGVAEFIDRVLLPTENVSEVKNGQQKIVEKRLWPGYLLVHMELTDDSWAYVKQTAGVLDFLGGAIPTPLTQKEVDEILRDLEEKKEKVTQKHKFAVGDAVKIVEGVFVNFVGTVTEVFHDKGRLSVLVSIFGRDTRVDDLEFSQVEEISEENESV